MNTAKSRFITLSTGILIKEEAGLIAGVITLAAFLTVGGGWLSAMSGWLH